jgi:hypothetical protein
MPDVKLRAISQRVRPVLFVGLMFLQCTALPAGEPWTAKSYTAWDRSDVHAILFDSPWVKHFTRTKRSLEFEVPDQGPTAMELRGYHAKESKEDGADATEFYVRWVSSRVVRQAWARRQALLKQDPASASAANLQPTLDEFVIAIAGRDMSGFQGVREVKLKAKGHLIVSSTNQKIAPTRVDVARSSDGRVRGIVFHFPKKTASGEPVISSHEKKVWFVEYGGEVPVTVSFYPQTMVDGKGLDL